MLRIAHISDLHLNDFLSRRYGVDTIGNFKMILSRLASSGISHILITGDFGSEEMYPELIEQLKSVGLPFYCVLGNHNELSGLRNTELVEDRNIKGDGYYYSERIGGNPFLFLDSSSGRIGTKQREWIRSELDKTGEGKLFIIVHHPILDCGTAMDRSLAMKERDGVASLLHESNRDIHIFCGHYHFANILVRGNIRQYVAPANIMQIRSEGNEIVSDSYDFGFRIIEIGDRVETETIMLSRERSFGRDSASQ